MTPKITIEWPAGFAEKRITADPVPFMILKDRSAFGPDEFIEVFCAPFKLRKFTFGQLKGYLAAVHEFC